MRDRSTIHDGASILRIISEPQRALEGEYWTNRRTTGELSLSFKSARWWRRFRKASPHRKNNNTQSAHAQTQPKAPSGCLFFVPAQLENPIPSAVELVGGNPVFGDFQGLWERSESPSALRTP
jgi:hypothetical protein